MIAVMFQVGPWLQWSLYHSGLPLIPVLSVCFRSSLDSSGRCSGDWHGTVSRGWSVVSGIHCRLHQYTPFFLPTHPSVYPFLCPSILSQSVHPSVCSSPNMSACAFIHPTIHLSVFLSISLFNQASVDMFVHPSIHPLACCCCFHPFVCFFMYPLLCPSFGQSLGLFVCSFIHSSVCLFVHLFIRLIVHSSSIRVSVCSSIHPSSISSSVCLFVLPFILPSLCSLCVSSSVCQSVHSPVSSFIRLSVRPSIHPFVCPFVCLFVHQSIHRPSFVCSSFHSPFRPAVVSVLVRLSLGLSIHPSVW